MDKRYQIFVSSTYVDLVVERHAVSQTLLSLNHFPAGMELFPASNDDQWTLIKGVIDDSDYYIIVVGGRYGSTGDDGLSYTEKEFDYAIATGKPILAFLHKSPGDIPSKNTDQNDEARKKLDAFRWKVQTDRTVKFWSTAENLSNAVFQAVSAETKKNPREGWIRANQSGDPAKLNELRDQVEQLKADLASVRTTAPQGSDLYEQGDDVFSIHYEYSPDWSIELETVIELTWDEIFYELGPLLLDESSEGSLRHRIADELHTYDDDIKTRPEKAKISNDAFETIKVQLIALGLMKKSEKKHAASDRNNYWQLTPYGEQYLIRLRAKKRKDTK